MQVIGGAKWLQDLIVRRKLDLLFYEKKIPQIIAEIKELERLREEVIAAELKEGPRSDPGAECVTELGIDQMRLA